MAILETRSIPPSCQENPYQSAFLLLAADPDHSPLTEGTMKKTLLAEASIDTFQAVVAAPGALCRLAAAQEDVALVLAEKVGEIKTRLAAAEVAVEEPVLSEQILLDLRRLKKNWTPRWRIISTPMVELQSPPQKPLHQAKQPQRQLTPMTLI